MLNKEKDWNVTGNDTGLADLLFLLPIVLKEKNKPTVLFRWLFVYLQLPTYYIWHFIKLRVLISSSPLFSGDFYFKITQKYF